MDMIEKRYEQPLPQDDIVYAEAPAADTNASANMVMLILKQWRMMAIIFLLVCTVGLLIIWGIGQTTYESTAAIRVAPIIPSILFDDRNSDGAIPMYDNFKNTQADLITSEQVLQRVADDLTDKNLTILKKAGIPGITNKSNPEIITAIKALVIKGNLRITPERKSELIKISMQGAYPEEMGQIIDAFVRAYMSIIVDEETKEGDQSLAMLENEAKILSNKLEQQQQIIRNMAGQTIGPGRRQLAIKDAKRQLDLTEELYARVQQRIQELEMERKRPARISVAYYANSLPVRSKRIKYTLALIFGAFGCGAGLAFLRAKADKSLYTPVDITKRIGVRLIGTTANIDHPDIPKLPDHIADEYQSIRANLELLNGGGIPKKLVITSSAIREGKTTFAVNFSTSLARSGRKVLLIDGDLRKPDIHKLLNLSGNSEGLRGLLGDKNIKNIVSSVPSAGFDVLTADAKDMSNAWELLSHPRLSKRIDEISVNYDHIVIDTPPVLAFPDALLWAKMADGVILTSFAGRTEEGDMKETLSRLEQINVNVLGVILHNVNVDSSYNRYSYGYYNNQATGAGSERKNAKAVLLLTAKGTNKTPDNRKS